jgi:multiple sugar transport system substrate-binding protein
MRVVFALVISLIFVFQCVAQSNLPLSKIESQPSTLRHANPQLNVLTVDLGTLISQPLIQRGLEFEQQTGIKVNVTKVPFGQLYNEISKDLSSPTSQYDIIAYASQWMVDFAQNNYLERLDTYVSADPLIQWNDVSRFFRDFSSKYNGQIYSIPLDGDIHLLYYRLDVLKKYGLTPPRTWDDYLAIAKQLHGVDMNGDGEGDFGSCISKKANEQSYWSLLSIAGSFLQSKGTSQGIFFNTKTMAPLVNNAAFKKALQIYKQTTEFGSADELNFDTNDVRYAFINGRCALAIEWGDIGTMTVLPESKVKNKTGVSILPGSTEVLNRKTNQLERCNSTLCPFAMGDINYAPYAAFGGWVGSINRASTAGKKKLAYEYLSYVTQPLQSNEDVTIGATGMNPYRTSQLVNQQSWLKQGMSENTLRFYLGSISKTVNNANIILDLRIFENNRYFRDILDTEVAKYLRHNQTVDQTVENIETGWNKLTDEIGRNKQLKAYRASLGLVATP